MAIAVETVTAPLTLVDQPVEKTASQKVREWTRLEIKGRTNTKAPELVKDGMAAIGTDDLMIELGRLAFYKIVLETIGEGRQVSAGPERTPEELKARSDQLGKKWSEWLEHSAEGHIAVTSMKYDDLMASVTERRKQVAPELATIQWLVDLAKKIKGTDLTVGQKLAPDQIEAIHRAALKKYKVTP